MQQIKIRYCSSDISLGCGQRYNIPFASLLLKLVLHGDKSKSRQLTSPDSLVLSLASCFIIFKYQSAMSTFITYDQPHVSADVPAEEPANVGAEQSSRARGLRRSRSGMYLTTTTIPTVIDHPQDAIPVACGERSATRAVRLAQRVASSA